MNWGMRQYDRLAMPQLVTNKQLASDFHPLHLQQPKGNDLSLTATAMPTFGTPLTPSVPRDRRSRHPDTTSTMRITKSSQQSNSIIRSTSEEKRPKLPLGPVLPPLMAPIQNPSTYPTTDTETTNDCDKEIDEDTTDSSSEESLIDDDDIIEELPPSTVGFEDENYTSLTSLIDVQLPLIHDKSSSYPSTLLQEHYLLEHQSQSIGLSSCGFNPRTNNIVRAYEIKGPLDVDLLQQSINKVVNLHPILVSKYSLHQSTNKVHVQQTSQANVKLDVSISYEKPSELITLARRKLFDATIEQNPSGSQSITRTNDILSIINCKDDSSQISLIQHETLPTLALPSITPINKNNNPFIRVKLVTKSNQDHLLVISFPRFVCDFWSSCLFMQHLVDAYSKLEKSSSYKPSMAVLRQAHKRQEAFNSIEMRRKRAGISIGATTDGVTRSLQKKPTHSLGAMPTASNAMKVDLRFSPVTTFKQIGLREYNLLLTHPKEKLWTFWEGVVTVIIKRLRGPSRIKIIPPLRIPTGYGEVARAVNRPTTSRLRPLTGRNRPTTARRSIFSLDGWTQESLNGPRRESEFIKVDESIGLAILKSFPEEVLVKINKREVLSMVSLGVYSVLLGYCCRGWGMGGSSRGGTMTSTDKAPYRPPPADPLLKYDEENFSKSSTTLIDRRGVKKRGFKLDVGSFLIGVDVSIRDISPDKTQGVFGPLTNTIGLRVDLSSHQCFTDLVLSLWKSLRVCRCYGFYPFHNISDEMGLVHGLPVRFSYLYPTDVEQLSNPDGFYFIETSVGVAKKALGRLGSCCYIDPLNTKMDDTCQLELFMWEGVRGENIDGLILYQPQLLKAEVIKLFKLELLKLFKVVSTNPTISLIELAACINPPFVCSGLKGRNRK
jgi:hypothetical protein